MQALLSYDQAPPLAAPARFFLTAPLFALAAGLLLLADGEAVFASRWGPSALALTHLFTAGFLLQIMLGALFQILPVVAGANMPRPLLFARIVHVATALGAVALVLGFLLGQGPLFHLAAGLLGSGVLVFLAGAGRALWRIPHSSPTIPALKIAIAGLAVTVILGLVLLAALLGSRAWPLSALTDLHAAWGLIAWGAALVAGVAYVVVPMFQLTPGFSARFSQAFVPALALSLLLWSAARWWQPEVSGRALQVVLAAALGLLAVTILRLQARSKRSRPDPTFRYWRLGMSCALLAATGFGVEALLPEFSGRDRLGLIVGTLAIFGALVSVVSGMLYKILPFLAWLHLQNAGGKGRVPHMGTYLGERAMQRQLHAHRLTLAALLAAALVPVLAPVAGAALVVSSALLLVNLASVLRRYAEIRGAGA